MVMRKPTGPDGQPPAGAAGPEPAVPYDAEEWDRRLLAARERRAQILALRGAGGGDVSPPVPVPPVAGLFAETDAPTPPTPPGPEAVVPRPARPAGPCFEGRMDRIARAMEAARQRSGDAAPAPASGPTSAPASGPTPASTSGPTPASTSGPTPAPASGSRSASGSRLAAEPLRRAVAQAPTAAVRSPSLPEPAAAAPRSSRLVAAMGLGAVMALGLAGGAYVMVGRPADPARGAVALADLGAADVSVSATQPAAEQAPERPSARVSDATPGTPPVLAVAAAPASPSLSLARDVPAVQPTMPAMSESAAGTGPVPAPAEPGTPQPAPRSGAEAAAPAVADAAAAGTVGLAAPAAAPAALPPPVEPVVPDPGAIRLRVNAPASAPATEVEAIGTALAGAGFPGVQTQRVGFTVSRTHLRYYNAEDAAAAQAIAARLGAEARDFTGYRPKPAVGTIEVWIAGTAPGGASRPGRAPQPQSGGLPSPAEAVQDIGQAVRTLVETFPANEQR